MKILKINAFLMGLLVASVPWVAHAEIQEFKLENKLELERMAFDLLINEQKNTRVILAFISGNQEL